MLGLLGAILTILSTFVTLRSVQVLTASCSDLADPRARDQCIQTGFEQHSVGFLLIGIGALVMTLGVVFGRSRPAAAALAAFGVAVLVVTLAIDVPDIHKTGVIGQSFEEAKGHAGIGLWVETAGGALIFVAGAIALAARPRARRRKRRRTTRAAA